MNPNSAANDSQIISDLLQQARTHLGLGHHAETRTALTEIFNLQYDHPEAALLKSSLEALESEAAAVRAQKEKLFTIAQRHQRQGELGSALTQLEKLLALPSPIADERDNVFKALHAELQTERDRIKQSSAEATQALSENNFEKALVICDSLQARYPNNPEFQALRLTAQQAQRKYVLVYVGEVARSVEAEPNLDGRVFLLQEAVKRYPNEDILAHQLALACEQRDLAASIVAKARAYESQGQLAEAIDQWKALQNIYSAYPGLAAEIQQLEQRREKKADEDKQALVLAEIDRALITGSYADAERLSKKGLRESPESPQLLTLLSNAQQGFEKCREADRLCEEAKTVRASGDRDRAITLLRQALHLDPRHIVARNTLVNLLLEHARVLLTTDAPAAEALAVEAAQFDPDHSSVHKLLKLVAKSKRKQPRQRALLEAAPAPAPLAPEPIKLFLDDDDFRDTPRTSPRFAPQPPPPAVGPAFLQPFREIVTVFAFNIKTRLLDSDWAPLLLKLSGLPRPSFSARQMRGFTFAVLGGLVPVLLLSFAHRSVVSRPPAHQPKPITVAPLEPTVAEPVSPEPSYATIDASPAADAPPKPSRPVVVAKKQAVPPVKMSAVSVVPSRAPEFPPAPVPPPQYIAKMPAALPAPTVVEQPNPELVNPDEAIKANGRWYHGRTDKYIHLTTNSSTNTLLFSKEFKVKRTSWRVYLDGNTITYTFDAKGICIEKHIDAHDTTERIKTDLGNVTSPSEAYAVTVRLEKNNVIIARPDGTPLHTTHTDDHDWSNASLLAKGDTYFSFLPGR